MSADVTSDFAGYVFGKYRIAGDVGARATLSEPRDGQSALRRLWELTDLSANDFAEEVAHFYRLPRAGLPQLLSGSALVKPFTRRFLRKMTAFPYRNAEGQL